MTTPGDGPTNARERAYARCLPWIDLHNDHRAKARFGSPEKRELYRRMADTDETMVGVLRDIARTIPESEP